MAKLLPLIVIVLLSSCASLNQVSEHKQLVASFKQQKFKEVIKSINEKKLLVQPKDRFLKSLQLGIAYFRDGDYVNALAFLDDAKQIARELYTVRASKKIESFLLSDANDIYYPNPVELSLIRFYELISHFVLSEDSRNKNRKFNRMAIETTLRDWHSYRDNMSSEKLGQAVFKGTILPDIMGYIFHDYLGGRLDRTKVKNFKSVALKNLKQRMGLYPSFNSKHKVYRDDFDKLHLISDRQLMKKYIGKTKTYTNVEDFLSTKANTYILILEGMGNSKSAKKYDIPLDFMRVTAPVGNKKDFVSFSQQMMSVSSLGNAKIYFELPQVKAKEIKKPKSVRLNIKSGMYLAEVNIDAAGKMLDTDFKKIREKVKNYNPHEKSSFDPKIKVKGNFKVEKVKSSDNNIIGVVYADDSDEYVVLGAHYDHLGHGEGGSLADDNVLHNIHNGADDNASGTAVVMELAEYYADLKKTNPDAIKKNLVFAFWSGEELGLLGSSEFMDQSEEKGIKYHSYLNYDMVGMLKDNKLSVQGAGSAENWRKLIEKKNIIAGFNLAVSDDPYLPTDATSFYKKEVPVIAFFTGLHDHYHRPSDDFENLNFEGMERIAKFSTKILNEVLEDKTDISYKKVEMVSDMNVRGFAVYLGTIPDYVADVEGVKLSGVRGGGPADKAGLKAEDIIVKLGKKDIKNIYDYTNILADLEAGKKYNVSVMRNGKKVDLTIIPGSK